MSFNFDVSLIKSVHHYVHYMFSYYSLGTALIPSSTSHYTLVFFFPLDLSISKLYLNQVYIKVFIGKLIESDV